MMDLTQIIIAVSSSGIPVSYNRTGGVIQSGILKKTKGILYINGCPPVLTAVLEKTVYKIFMVNGTVFLIYVPLA